MEAVLIADGRETVLLRWEFPAAAENINIPGPQLRVELPQMQNRRFELALRVAGKPEWDSVYSFILSHTAWQVTGLMGQSVPQMPPD
jgi:hypothetical protein